MTIQWSLLLSGTLLAIGAADATPSAWRATAHYTLGGEGGWDLMTVDAKTHRIYVTRGDRVIVVDLDHGTAVGEVPGLNKAHGVALVPDLQRGFVTSGGDDAVIAFDTANLKVIAKIAVDHNPDAITYDPKSRKVIAFNARSSSASVIDPESNARVATIPLPGKPELAESSDEGVFVNLEDVGKLARLDVGAGKLTATWDLADCEEPTGIAIDAKHARVFSVCQNRHMVVTDSRTGRHVASVPIGDGPDGAVFDAESGDAFSSNSDGTLTIVHEDDPDHFSVAQTVSTPARARCIALDAFRHRVVLATAKFGATPKATAGDAHPRPPMEPGSFGLLVLGKE